MWDFVLGEDNSKCVKLNSVKPKTVGERKTSGNGAWNCLEEAAERHRRRNGGGEGRGSMRGGAGSRGPDLVSDHLTPKGRGLCVSLHKHPVSPSEMPLTKTGLTQNKATVALLLTGIKKTQGTLNPIKIFFLKSESHQITKRSRTSHNGCLLRGGHTACSESRLLGI